MNYITKLRTEIASQQAEIAALRDGMRDLLAHVASSKFHGPENAWISTVDVTRLIHEIEHNGTIAGEA